MKISALVLSFAMALTLLAGISFNVQAADDTGSTMIYCAYNPNDGDHLFTPSQAEYNNVVRAGWAGQDVAWKAPVSSETPAYRIYNPNSGEHMFMTSKAEADAAIAAGWNDEGIGFYSDDEQGVPVYRVFNPNATGPGSHYFTKDANEAAGLVAVGWRDEGVGLYGVADASAEIQLIDESGLQENNTATQTDVLSLVYGSDMGTPNNIVWYKDGAAAAAYALQGGGIVNGFNNKNIMTLATDGKMPTGTWYVQVENTEGKTFTTNTIIVSDENVDAVVSDFSISDSYAALQALGTGIASNAKKNFTDDEISLTASNLAKWIPINTVTSAAVIDVTVSKAYTGAAFYLVESDEDQVSNNTHVLKINSANLTNVNKASNFTDKKLFQNAIDKAGSATAKYGQISAVGGIYYTETSGVTHYKFFSGMEDSSTTVERGTNYKLIYETTGNTPSNTDSIDDYVTTEAYQAPYVMAPDALTVTGRQTSATTAGWEAQLSIMGMDAQYINHLTYTDNYAQITFWANSSVKNTGGTMFDYINGASGQSATNNTGSCLVVAGANAAPKGTLNYGDSTSKAVYAEFHADKGVFGDDVLDLVSPAVETATAPANSMEISESTDTPENAIVSFESLSSYAGGTVTLYKMAVSKGATAASEAATIIDKGTEVASADVAGGVSSVEIEDVFSNSDIGKYVFAAKLVPDSEVYGDLDTTTNNLVLTNSVQTLYLSDDPTSVTVDVNNNKDKEVTIKGLNQFGKSMDLDSTYNAVVSDISSALTFDYGSSTSDGAITVANVAGTGIKINISGAANTGSYIGGSYLTLKLKSGQTLKMTVASTSTAQSEAALKVSIID